MSDFMVSEVPWPTDVPAAVAHYARRAELAWLDSVTAGSRRGGDDRYSLVCTRPLAVLSQHEGSDARLAIGARSVERAASLWDLWRRVHGRLPRKTAGPWAVSPGWVGYLGFELARQLERLPASRCEDLGLPLGRLALFDRAIVLDHATRRAWAVCSRELAAHLDTRATDDAWLGRWMQAASHVQTAAARQTVHLQPQTSQAAHERIVARGLDYISAGDIYQVNLAQRLRVSGIDNVMDAYTAVRAANPAPYAGLLRWDDSAVASLSPELFLRLSGDRVLTRPIKGTRPRTGDDTLDAAQRQALLDSAKEAAELAMIIDLHRNDLGRVCRYGSVRVARARGIEEHPTVFHTVADVVGRLRPEHDAIDLLAACFPAGSISGVPKIRAIEIINELEPVARGAYTGAVGALGLDGQMTFNVAIRTLQIRGRAATLYVGGGIVADSDPTAEYEETLAKARGILRGLGVAEVVSATTHNG